MLAAWLVHTYTASAAAFGLWAIVACFSGQTRLAMGLMLLTLIIDSTDGTLARALDVRRKIPWFDGRRLDDICDYFTYVIVPACFLICTGLLPHPVWAAIPVLASAYGFSRVDAKTDDHFFIGFPSSWNVLAIYLFLFKIDPLWVATTVALFGVLVFVPTRYIYPSRTRALRPVTIAVLGAWTLGFTWLAVQPRPAAGWVALSLVGPVYYFALSLVLHVSTRRAKLGA